MCRSPAAACATAVLEAMRRVPREAFVEPGFEEFAYEDRPLPIGEGQTISQPYIVALMIEAAEVKPGDRVLEVGTGSGYAAAVLSRIAGRVYAIERHRRLLAMPRASASASSATTTSSCASATARSAGPRPRRSMPSWWPPADRECRSAEGATRDRRPAGHSGRRRRRAAARCSRSRARAKTEFDEDDLGAVRVRAADRRTGLGRRTAALGQRTTCRARRADNRCRK